jgi:hypothetical protein
MGAEEYIMCFSKDKYRSLQKKASVCVCVCVYFIMETLEFMNYICHWRNWMNRRRK